MKIPGDWLSGIPLCFRWHLGINSFWRQLISLLELSCCHLRINSFWRQLGSPSGFAIPRYSFLGIPPCFPPLGLTMLIRSWGTTYFPVGILLYFCFLGELHQSPKEKISYSPLDPVAKYAYIEDLNTRLCVSWKTLPDLNFKIKFQTQISNSNLNSRN